MSDRFPCVHARLRPRGHRHCPHLIAFSDDIDNCPAPFTLFDVMKTIKIAASARRRPQPIKTASSARSRTPFKVFVPGALSHLWASSLVSQLPVRLPRNGTPLTARTPLAILESIKLLSSASVASFLIDESFWLIVDDESFRSRKVLTYLFIKALFNSGRFSEACQQKKS